MYTLPSMYEYLDIEDQENFEPSLLCSKKIAWLLSLCIMPQTVRTDIKKNTCSPPFTYFTVLNFLRAYLLTPTSLPLHHGAEKKSAGEEIKRAPEERRAENKSYFVKPFVTYSRSRNVYIRRMRLGRWSYCRGHTCSALRSSNL